MPAIISWSSISQNMLVSQNNSLIGICGLGTCEQSRQALQGPLSVFKKFSYRTFRFEICTYFEIIPCFEISLRQKMYINAKIFKDSITRVFIPYVNKLRSNQELADLEAVLL
jgi:hypothetical protein